MTESGEAREGNAPWEEQYGQIRVDTLKGLELTAPHPNDPNQNIVLRLAPEQAVALRGLLVESSPRLEELSKQRAGGRESLETPQVEIRPTNPGQEDKSVPRRPTS